MLPRRPATWPRLRQLLDGNPQLGRARAFSQIQLAKTLQVAQSEVSKIEHRTDLYLSTVRSYVEAMGGELQLVAKFPDGNAVLVNQFRDLEEENETALPKSK